MGFISTLRQKYFGKQAKKKLKKKAVLFFGSVVPRQLRRQCWNNLPFTNKQKKQIRVVNFNWNK